MNSKNQSGVVIMQNLKGKLLQLLPSHHTRVSSLLGSRPKKKRFEDQKFSDMDFHETKDTAKIKKTIWFWMPWPIDVGPERFWSNLQDCQYRQLHELKTREVRRLCIIIIGDGRERGRRECSSDRQFFGRIAPAEDHRQKCNDSVAK